MHQSTDMMDLIGSYESYARADELNVSAAADAPATTWPCWALAKTSVPCYNWFMRGTQATVQMRC